MGGARLRLIGAFQLVSDDGATVDVSSRRARALLAYLVLGTDRSATREHLCGLLWSDRGEGQARASLRQCLLDLRAALAPIEPFLLVVTRDDVRLDRSRLGADTDDLEAALASDDARALTEHLDAAGEHRLLGDLDIPGLFRDWRDQVRARFDQRLAAGVLAHLETRCAAGDWNAARALADAYLRREPLDEAVAAIAIRADGALGATASAHRRFQAIKSALAAEFGAAPSPALRAALAELSETDVGRTGIPGPPPAAAERPTRGAARPRLAVLPFGHGAGDEEQAAFAEALVDDLIAGLCKAPLLSVSQTPAPIVAGERTIAALCEVLGVDYVVRGKVRRMGSALRVSVELIRGSDEASTWSARYDRTPDDLFSVLDEMTFAIVGALEPAVLELEEAHALKTTGPDLTFWQLFIRARQLFWQATAREVHEAGRLIERALALQPDDASALAIQSHCKLYDVWVGAAKDPAASISEAYDIARRAVRVAPGDAYAHFTLGVVLTVMDRITEAEAELRLALDLNPYLAVALGEMGRLLAFAGRSEESIVHCDRAIAASPNDPQTYLWFRVKSIARFVAGDYDAAARDAADAVARGPHRFFLHLLLSACYAAGGRTAEAREAARNAWRLQYENAGTSPPDGPPRPRSALSLRLGHPFVSRADLERFTKAVNRASESLDPHDYSPGSLMTGETQ